MHQPVRRHNRCLHLFIAVTVAASAAMGCRNQTPEDAEPAEEDVGQDATVEKSMGEQATEETVYRSEYFVFVSFEANDALIMPVDLNWEATESDGVFLELKAWRGALDEQPWPMRYVTTTREETQPVEDWRDLELGDHFAWSGASDTLTVDIEGAPTALMLSGFGGATSVATQTPSGGSIVLEAGVGRAGAPAAMADGWILHETVRMARPIKQTRDVPMFGRYHWFVVAGPDGETLYWFVDNAIDDPAFEQHRAARWTRGEQGWAVAQTEEFALEVVTTKEDAQSGRGAVPVQWRITCEEWGLDEVVVTQTHHTGYGPERDSGKALYRQGLVRGERLHGMIELILED